MDFIKWLTIFACSFFCLLSQSSAVDAQSSANSRLSEINEILLRGYLSQMSTMGNNGLQDSGLNKAASRLPGLPNLPSPYNGKFFRLEDAIGTSYESSGILYFIGQWIDDLGPGFPHSQLYRADQTGIHKVDLGHEYGALTLIVEKPDMAVIEAYRAKTSEQDYFLIRGGAVSPTHSTPIDRERPYDVSPGHIGCSYGEGIGFAINHSRSSGSLGASIPSVRASCYTIPVGTLFWLSTGSDGLNGITYLIRGANRIALSAGYPIVVSPHYLIFRDNHAWRYGQRPYEYELIHSN